MQNVQNVTGTVIQQPIVQKTKFAPSMNFKAGEVDSFVRQSSSSSPQEAEMMRMIQEKRKEQEKSKKKQKWMNALQIGALVSSIAIAGCFIFSMLKGKSNKVTSAGGSSRVEDELKALTGFDLKLTDLKNSTKKVASIESETTNTGIKRFFKEVINASGDLSAAAKKYANVEEGSQVIYMYGHGGTGKTYGAKQIAQELNALFASVKCSELASPYKDASSMKVTAFFDSIIDAATKNPDRKIVVCIDEFDSILKLPGVGGDKDADKVRSALLPGIESVTEKCKNVIFVATSNYRPDHPQIDSPAISRFIKLKMELPDLKQVKALLKMYMGNGDYIDSALFDSKEFNDFAKKLVDGKYSSREIEKMAKAGKKAFESSLKGISDADLSRHKYTMEFLEKGKQVIGDAAAMSDVLM